MTAGAPVDSKPEAKLAAGFASATREQWLKLVDKAIKGADFEKKLVSKTADGIRIEPIYVRDGKTEEVSLPGSAPFTRGTHAQVAGLGWEIRQTIAEADPATANTQILTELEGGANGITLEIEAPGQLGLRVTGAGGFAKALEGVDLEMAPVELRAGLGGLAAARQLLEALPALGANPATARLFLGVDPIGSLARWGLLPEPIEASLLQTAKLAKGLGASAPNIRTVRADGTIYHEAGATEGYELAALASTFVAYLRAFEAAGISPAEAMGHISFAVSADTEQFATIAKLRAARQLIWRIADASGAGAKAAEMHITAVSSRRMMAKRDPWTNMLRTTLACAGAALGGADAITVLPFTVALGQPDAFTRRAARNIQIVLQEESNLGRVLDPMGGSWYIETLTDELAKTAWKLFQDIEAQGGIVAALTSGAVQDKIAADTATRAKAIATGRQELTGVSAFPLLGDDGVTVSPYPATPKVEGKTTVRPLTPHRLGEAFEDLRDTADAHAAKTGKADKVFLASIGAVIDHTLRTTWIKNYLAAGGIGSLASDGYKNADEAAAAFKASGCNTACICSSDALYAEHAEATAKALKAAGAVLVLMAGRPGDKETAYKAAGVDQFLFAGVDAVAVLKGLHEKLGVAA